MDPILLLSQGLLYALGAIAVAISDPEAIPKHLLRIAVSLVATLVASRIPLRVWIRYGPILFLFSIVLLALTLAFGETHHGSKRWLAFHGFRFQPSELTKLAVIFYLVQNRKRHGADHPIAGPVILFGLAAALILLEPDFSGSVLFFAIALVGLLTLGVPLRRIVAFGIFSSLLALALFGLYQKLFAHVRERIQAFFQGTHEQVLLAKKAILAGGVFGQGPGAKLHYIPFSSTDMTLAVLAYGLGVIGVVLLIVAYTLVLCRSLSIARQAPESTGAIAVTLTVMILLSAFLHIAVVLGLFPVTGLPLPLVSYGGSAMLIYGLAFGILHRAAREAKAMDEESA